MNSILLWGSSGLRISYIVLLSSLVLVLGCHKPGLVRTSLEEWGYEEFQKSCVRIEVPRDYFYSGGGSPSGVGYLMHPVWPSWGVLGEPQCLLEIEVRYLSADEVKEEEEWAEEADRDGQEYLSWVWSRCQTLNRYDDDGQVIYRRDVPCRNDAVLVGKALLMKTGDNDKYQDLDEAAMRRILSSLECMESVPDSGKLGS